jgi:membrane protease YdiL (CAAX protease family)
MKQPQTKTDSPRFWERIPKWLLPLALLVAVALIYFVSQYASSIILSIYAAARGMNAAQANSWLTNSVSAQFFYVLFFEAFTVSILYLALRHYGRSLKTIGLKAVRWRDGGFALIAFPVYFIIYLIAVTVVQHVYPSINISQSQNIGFNSVHGNSQLALTFISLVILPPLAEELLFRGFLFEGLKKAMPVVYAGVLTSVLFAVAHLPEGSGGLFWIGALDVFILSLVLVFLKQKTKSLWPGIFLHALKNLVAFISLFLLTNR